MKAGTLDMVAKGDTSSSRVAQPALANLALTSTGGRFSLRLEEIPPSIRSIRLCMTLWKYSKCIKTFFIALSVSKLTFFICHRVY